ncbi:MAG: nuclear transport factor 2 family protein [Candidatus Acidiferrales bacterium]
MNAAEKELRGLVGTLIKGLQTENMQIVEQVYDHSPSLLVFLEGPQMKVKGWSELKKAISEFLRTHTRIESRLNNDSRFIVTENLGVFYGTFRLRAVDRETREPIKWTARNTFVFRKIHGKWKVVHEHDSFPAAPPVD